ncbi:MAG: hypothetical protein AB7R77_12775 [Ilumatobacteraceae bacterium]
MPREVGQTQKEFAPTVVRSRIGESITLCLVDERNVPSTQTINGQRVPRTDPKTGKQKFDLVVTCIVVQGDMKVGRKTDDDLRAPVPGEVVELYLSKGAYSQYIEAKGNLLKATGRKTALSGDVIYMTTDKAELYTQEGDRLGVFETQEQVNAHRLAGKPGTIGMRGALTMAAPTPEYAQYVQLADDEFDRRQIERTQRPVGEQAGPFDEERAFAPAAPAVPPMAPPPVNTRRLV